MWNALSLCVIFAFGFWFAARTNYCLVMVFMVVCDLQVVCLLFCRRLLDLAADAAKLNDVIVPPNHLAIE